MAYLRSSSLTTSISSWHIPVLTCELGVDFALYNGNVLIGSNSTVWLNQTTLQFVHRASSRHLVAEDHDEATSSPHPKCERQQQSAQAPLRLKARRKECRRFGLNVQRAYLSLL